MHNIVITFNLENKMTKNEYEIGKILLYSILEDILPSLLNQLSSCMKKLRSREFVGELIKKLYSLTDEVFKIGFNKISLSRAPYIA
jgi:hypothetical protein